MESWAVHSWTFRGHPVLTIAGRQLSISGYPAGKNIEPADAQRRHQGHAATQRSQETTCWTHAILGDATLRPAAALLRRDGGHCVAVCAAKLNAVGLGSNTPTDKATHLFSKSDSSDAIVRMQTGFQLNGCWLLLQ